MNKTLKVLAATIALTMLIGLTGCINGKWDEAEADGWARETIGALVGAIEDFEVEGIDYLLADDFMLHIYEDGYNTQNKSKATLMGELEADEAYQLLLRDEEYTMGLNIDPADLISIEDPETVLILPIYEGSFMVEELAALLGLDPVWISDTGWIEFKLVWDASGEYKVLEMHIWFDAEPVVPVPEG
jgi:hypothetical protein